MASARRESLERSRARMAEAFTTAPRAEDRKLWESALYAATVLPPDSLVRQGVRKALAAYAKLPEEFQRQALETAYGVDPQTFLAEVAAIAELTTSPKHFAMASLYLCRGLPDGAGARCDALERLERRFPSWTSDPILTMLHFDLSRGSAHDASGAAGTATEAATGTDEAAAAPRSAADLVSGARPPLSVLLSRRFAPGWPVVYSLQRPDRSWPGLALVRRPDGRFHRNPDGTLFHISQLARSRTNLPGYLTNGNTPQGIFSVSGLGRSRLLGIGPTPYLRLYLPQETSPDRWFHEPSLEGTTWSLEMYRRMLPPAAAPGEPAWRDYFPAYTAWYAGTAGRNDILAHGTTVDPSRSEGRSWFPFAPTSGCLCAKEIWDETTGQALISDQLALAHAWLVASGVHVPRTACDDILTLDGRGPDGFLVVVELDDVARPVTLDEVVADVLKAER